MGMAHTVEVLDASIRGAPASTLLPRLTHPSHPTPRESRCSSKTREPSPTRSPSAPCAPLIPLAVLFLLLGGLKIRAWISGLVSLAVALVVAVALFGMPVGQGISAGDRRRACSASSRSCGS